MADMIICGLSMEMELAEEMGTVGKCIGCHYFEGSDEVLYCAKKKKFLDKEKENCQDWLVNHR